jgi:tetratricopeptide (TPR) repeat protein
VNIAEIAIESKGRSALQLVFEDTLQPFVEISCDAAASYAIASQAGVARARGELARALALVGESAARFEAAGDEAGQAAALVRRAYIELADDGLPAARTSLERALELRRRLSDRRGFALALSGLGYIDTLDGEYESAEAHLAEALDIFRRAGDRWGIASTLWRTADLALARGSVDKAETALLEARSVLDATGRERWIASTLSSLAELAVLRGDLGRAAALLADARDRYAARDYASGVANVEERLRLLAKTPAKGARRGAG